MPTPLRSMLGALHSSTKDAVSSVLYHAWTIVLFSKSDIKTTLIPVSLFSLGAAPLSSTNSFSHAIQAVVWIWLHLLEFNLCNQIRDPEEDIRNKPWRPLPSGRISLQNTIYLKRFVIALCLLVSYSYSTTIFYASLFFAFLIPTYHELKGDSHWLSKNLMNAVGYTCFALGSTLVASSDRSKLDFVATLSISVIAAILATTIQAQDFQDEIGDRLVGRSTLCIAFPNGSRYTPLISLVGWSFYLGSVWEISTIAFAFHLTLAIIVGARYFLWRTVRDDQISYFIYNIWLAFAFSVPGYWRMYKEVAAY